MKRRFHWLVLFSFIAFFVQGQNAQIVSLEELQNEISNPSDKIQVFNFWATWCRPCIKELPLFEKVHLEDQSVRITLVSMDIDLNPNPQKVYDFVTKKDLKSRVVILDAVDPNSWIESIDANWSGALPATLVINTVSGKRLFVNNELKEGELEKLILAVK